MLKPSAVKYIVVHCSATPEGRDFRASDIDRWHRQQGWRCIGYHFVVDLDGTVEAGRKLSEVGAHVSGYNYCSVGVCYIGGLDSSGKPADTRTLAQRNSLLTLIRMLHDKFPSAVILGHRDLGAPKACPCFNAKQEYSHV